MTHASHFSVLSICASEPGSGTLVDEGGRTEETSVTKTTGASKYPRRRTRRSGAPRPVAASLPIMSNANNRAKTTLPDGCAINREPGAGRTTKPDWGFTSTGNRRLAIGKPAVACLLLLAACGTSEPAFEIVQPELFSAPGAQPNAWADYDNDGDLDLFVGFRGAPDRLYRNDGGVFVNVAPEVGLANGGRNPRSGLGGFRSRWSPGPLHRVPSYTRNTKQAVPQRRRWRVVFECGPGSRS